MSYSTIQDHQYMLFDTLRNSLYFEAIKNAVNHNSTVLDLGSGLGLHGFMAHSQGAKKVYLVEPSPIFDVTKMVMKANAFSEKIACIPSKIEEAALPEKMDVIISVFTGNFLLTEDLLPSLFYARDTYLRPGGKMIPDRAKMVVAPVSAPDYYAKHIDCWSKPLYGVDYSIARKFATNSLYYDPPERRKTFFLSEPADLLDLDFMTANEAACQNTIKFKTTSTGILHGFLGWFDTRLGDKWLSTSPQGEQTHWRQVFLPLESPIHVQKGDFISFDLKRPEFGEWSWTVGFNNTFQKHSTFLSMPLKTNDLLKQLDGYQGTVSSEGIAIIFILQKLNGKNTIESITDKLVKKYSDLFPDRKSANIFTKKIVKHYSI